MATINIPSEDGLRRAAREFVAAMQGRSVFAFYGAMGAGKTTFIKAVCEELGVTDVVNSPTFAIVNEYRRPDGRPIFHFDFYRIKCPQEVFDMGFDDYVYTPDALCFIEWPEMMEQLLPSEAVPVSIKEREDGSREVRLVER